MFRHDARNTGRGAVPGPRKGVRQWRFKTDGYIYSSPVVSADGTIHFGSEDNRLYAVAPNGVLSWSYEAGERVYAPPAIGPEEAVYFVSGDRRIYNLSSGGAFLWSYEAQGDLSSAPTVDGDGRVYAGSWDNTLYVLDSGGALEWSYTDGWPISCQPALGADGRVRYGTWGSRINSLTSAGALEWSFAAWGGIDTAVSLGPDDEVYFACPYQRLLAALSSSGTFLWSYYSAENFFTSPAVGASGTVYGGAYDNVLYAFDPSGALSWSYDTGVPMSLSSPALDSDGAVYVGTLAFSGPAMMLCLSSAGEFTWSYRTSGDITSSPAIGLDERLYVGAMDRRLYAFFDPTATPTPTAPTPTPTSTPTLGPPEAAFAVGSYYDPGASENYVKIFQRHGMRWLDVSPLLPGYLNSVRVVSDTEAWAVGSYNNNLLALRWDGSTWTDLSPGIEGWSSDIDGLPGGGRAVGVSSYWDEGTDKSWMRIWEWDGAAWTDVSPLIEGSLNSVDLVSGSEGYAVGSVYDSGTWKNYVKIVKWDGATWTDISPPGVEGGLACVRMVGPGEGYAVGSRWDGVSSRLLLMRCTGGAWTDIFVEDGNASSISPISMTEAYTAGTQYDDDLETNFPVIKRWNGSSFTDISPSGVEGGLNSIWMRSSSEGCAVGGWHDPVANAPYVRILEYDGSSWIDVSPGSEGQLGSVSLGPSAGDTPTPTLTPTPTRTPTPTPTAVVCGDSFSGDTTGGTSAWEYYGGLTDWRESGPETAYRFVNDAEHDVTVNITTDEDLDIFLLSGLDPALLVRRGQGVLVKTYLPAGEYWLVVDGHEGAAGPFHLALSCTTPLPTPSPTPTVPTPTPTPTPTSHPALTIQDLEDAVIKAPSAGGARIWRIGVMNVGGTEYGSVFDNENLYTDGAVSAAPAQTYLRVEVQPPSGENLGIESGYEISLRYDGGRELNVCLPDLRAHYTAKLYVGADGSTWWDQGLHVPAHAACAASPTPTPTPTAPPTTLFFNFMPPELEPPAGWTKDDGEPYGTHGGWGWI